jgi:hypothetical protein
VGGGGREEDGGAGGGTPGRANTWGAAAARGRRREVEECWDALLPARAGSRPPPESLDIYRRGKIRQLFLKLEIQILRGTK